MLHLLLSCTSCLLLLLHASLLTPMCSPPGACLRRCWPWRSTATCRTWRRWWRPCCGTWCSRAAAALSPNCCCDAPSPSWRSCSPTGCPSASTASSGSAALASYQCYVCFLGRVLVAKEEFPFFLIMCRKLRASTCSWWWALSCSRQRRDRWTVWRRKPCTRSARTGCCGRPRTSAPWYQHFFLCSSSSVTWAEKQFLVPFLVGFFWGFYCQTQVFVAPLKVSRQLVRAPLPPCQALWEKMQRAALFAPILSRDGAQWSKQNKTRPLWPQRAQLESIFCFTFSVWINRFEKKSWCHVWKWKTAPLVFLAGNT